MSNLRPSPPLSPEELIRNIDWKLLNEQKQRLAELLDLTQLQQEDYGALEGILSLLDEIQDCAVDYLEIPEKEVFNLSNE